MIPGGVPSSTFGEDGVCGGVASSLGAIGAMVSSLGGIVAATCGVNEAANTMPLYHNARG